MNIIFIFEYFFWSPALWSAGLLLW